jgi:hypothetical protein
MLECGLNSFGSGHRPIESIFYCTECPQITQELYVFIRCLTTRVGIGFPDDIKKFLIPWSDNPLLHSEDTLCCIVCLNFSVVGGDTLGHPALG